MTKGIREFKRFTPLGRPALRKRRGQPLILLTTPADKALVINPLGQIEVCSLSGVSGYYGGEPSGVLTDAQKDTLRGLVTASEEFLRDDMAGVA